MAPDKLDSLIISASVLDDFSDTLNELSVKLAQVDAEAEQVDPIDIDTTIADALADIELLNQRLNALDKKDVDVDVDTDTDPLQQRVSEVSAIGQRRVANMVAGDRAGPTGISADVDPFDRREARGSLLHSRIMQANPLDLLSEGVADSIRRADIPGGRERGPGRALMDEFLDLRLYMSGLMNTMAALVPLMGVFVGALPAAISGLVALAGAAVAAAGALAAPLALGFGGMVFAGGELNVSELQDEIRDTLDTFLESFTPLMEALQPMVEGLFDQFRFLIRDISRRGNVLMEITNEIAGAFEWMFEVMGPALEDFMRFGQAVMPIMELLIGGLASFDWFEIFADILAQTLPLFQILATQIVNIMPALFEISMGFFMVADAIFVVLGYVAKLIDIVPFLGEGFGILIGALFAAVSATALYSVATSNIITKLITMAITALPSVINQLYLKAVALTNVTAATWGFIGAASILLGVLTFGLGPAIGGIAGEFFGLGDGVGKATDELRRFNKQSSRVGGPDFGGGPPGFGPSGPSYGRGFGGGNTTVVAPDQETGNAIAANGRWQSGWSPTQPESDDANKKHSK